MGIVVAVQVVVQAAFGVGPLAREAQGAVGDGLGVAGGLQFAAVVPFPGAAPEVVPRLPDDLALAVVEGVGRTVGIAGDRVTAAVVGCQHLPGEGVEALGPVVPEGGVEEVAIGAEAAALDQAVSHPEIGFPGAVPTPGGFAGVAAELGDTAPKDVVTVVPVFAFRGFQPAQVVELVPVVAPGAGPETGPGLGTFDEAAAGIVTVAPGASFYQFVGPVGEGLGGQVGVQGGGVADFPVGEILERVVAEVLAFLPFVTALLGMAASGLDDLRRP